jgi:hypothetical protein
MDIVNALLFVGADCLVRMESEVGVEVDGRRSLSSAS